ncbi:DsrE family protein [Actinoplanes sp. NPDC051346]|uniref:DsrE/DsrF/TusD sulfur relay family protein n=1 Tax=Actinoplanes sp. NPDC051346 TaxID=3155048 RepID=UPI003436F6BF
MKYTVILNDGPGTERTFNGLRLAGALAERPDTQVRLYCFGDAVACAAPSQRGPEGQDITELVAAAVRAGATLRACKSCLQTRGLADTVLVDGTAPATLTDCADDTAWADKVLTF